MDQICRTPSQYPFGIRELLHGAGKHTEEIYTLTYRHTERDHARVIPPTQDVGTEPEMLSVRKSSTLEVEGPQHGLNEGQYASQKEKKMSTPRSSTIAILQPSPK